MMLGQATQFEFEQRFFVFGALFGLAFFITGFEGGMNAVLITNALGGDEALLQAILAVGAALVGGAAWVRTWATAYLTTAIVHDMTQHSEGLVADGPYRHTRNPLYFANMPLAAGFAFLTGPLGGLFLMIGMLVVHMRLIAREEAGLTQIHGAGFAAYCAAVPRFWPAWRAQVPVGGGAPRWRQAFLGESLFWGFALAVAGLAATLSTNVLFVILGLSFPIYFLGVRRAQRDNA